MLSPNITKDLRPGHSVCLPLANILTEKHTEKHTHTDTHTERDRKAHWQDLNPRAQNLVVVLHCQYLCLHYIPNSLIVWKDDKQSGLPLVPGAAVCVWDCV
jgi:Pyruvate/2-oxoacid:ferredoxin oxidoreductase delta subunit